MTQLFALGEVATINPDTSIPFCADDLCSFVPMDAIDEATGEINRLATRPYKDVAKGYTSFIENDVLLAKITPCMENGKCALARGLRNGIGFGSRDGLAVYSCCRFWAPRAVASAQEQATFRLRRRTAVLP
jgi:hypothetical protein